MRLVPPADHQEIRPFTG